MFHAKQKILSAFRPKRCTTAGEFIQELESDPDFMRARSERERKFAELEAQSRASQKSLLADLASAGVNVKTVWDLVNTSSDYSFAIPILLKHLQDRSYPDGVREGIARALAVRATQKLGWRILVEEFCETDPSNKRVKDGLAVALAVSADRNVLSELIELAKDKRHGSSRILLLIGIRRSRSVEAQEAIEQLADDPQLALEIQSWKRRPR